MYGDVEVRGIDDHPGGPALAGPRPRHGKELAREKIVSVRLRLVPGDTDAVTAIAVVTEDDIPIGDVDPARADRMAPALDGFLRRIATPRERRGCSVDVRCSAFLTAEWRAPEDLSDGDDPWVPSELEIILLIDDGDLGYKISPPKLTVGW